MLTHENMIDRAESACASLGEVGDLSAYAAQDAVKVLLENWRPALADGCDPVEMAGDVERVIIHLRNFATVLRR